MPIVFIGYYLLVSYANPRVAKNWLVVSSLLFYTWWGKEWLLLLLASTAFNFGIAHLIARVNDRKKKGLLTLGVTTNILILAYFKYRVTIILGINYWLDFSLPVPGVFLPLALSFFSFHQIAYLVDVYKKRVIPEKNFSNYCLFVSFFPHLIAGPIIYYREIIPQFLSHDRYRINTNNLKTGLLMFAIGLVKKTAIADPIGNWVDAGFLNFRILNQGEALATAYLYGLQIYFDFSSYGDMALGLALLFNINLPVNFYSPFKARNIQEFWQRWNITLSRFFRDYVYIPLGGNRGSIIKQQFNLIVVMVISGIWHGSSWWFLVWGFLHGIGMSVHSLWKKTNIKLPDLVGTFITINFFILTMVFFRSTSWDQATHIYQTLFGFGEHGWVLEKSNLVTDSNTFYWLFVDRTISNTFVAITVLSTLILGYAVCFFCKNTVEISQHIENKNYYWFKVMLLLMLGIIMISEYTPFIYFQF